MSQYKATTNSIKTLKQACQFLTQAPVDTNKRELELLLSSVGVSSSNFSNKQATSQPQLVTELTLFN